MNALTNFEKTLRELKNYLSLPIQNDRDREGIIQAFEFTFEQAWKSIQKIAASQGVEVGSPKKAFAFAMQNQWIPIKDEANWLNLIKDRNLAAHTYEESLAKEILARIQQTYLRAFEDLLANLEAEINV